MKASTCIQDPVLSNCWQGQAQDASPKQHARQGHKPNHQQSSQRHPKTPPHTALPMRGGKIPPPSRRQAQASPNVKPVQTTELTSPSKGRDQK